MLEGSPLSQHCQPIKLVLSFKETDWFNHRRWDKIFGSLTLLGCWLWLSAPGLRFLKGWIGSLTSLHCSQIWLFGLVEHVRQAGSTSVNWVWLRREERCDSRAGSYGSLGVGRWRELLSSFGAGCFQTTAKGLRRPSEGTPPTVCTKGAGEEGKG